MKYTKIVIILLLLLILNACETENSTGCPNENPVINGVCFDITKPSFVGINDLEVELGSPFDPLENVEAVDDVDGNITEDIIVIGEVDTTSAGTYLLEYKVTDHSDNMIIELRYITVMID